MTRDHKATDPVERARVGTAGVLVANGRVMNSLAVARAVGDKHMKTGCCGAPLVTPEAEVSATLLRTTDEFALLACDGAFDVMGCSRAIGVVRHQLALGRSPEEAAEYLAKLAVEEGSSDNVSVLVVILGAGVGTDSDTVAASLAGAALPAELDVSEEAASVRQEAAEEAARRKADNGVTSALALEVEAPERDGNQTRRAAESKGGFSFGSEPEGDGEAKTSMGSQAPQPSRRHDDADHFGGTITLAPRTPYVARNATWDEAEPEEEEAAPKNRSAMHVPRGIRGVPLPALEAEPNQSAAPSARNIPPSAEPTVGGAAVDADEYHSDSELTRDGNQTSSVAERKARARAGGGADRDAAGGFFGGGRAFQAEPSRDGGAIAETRQTRSGNRSPVDEASAATVQGAR